MSGKKTPDNKKKAEKSHSSPEDEITSPLVKNSFGLAPEDSRSSNLRHGAIGGPTAPVHTSRAQSIRPPITLPFRHTTSLANLSVIATGNQRQLRSNQPGNSYVTNLPTWRRGPVEDVPRPAATRDEAREQTRAGALQGTRADEEERFARANARATEYREEELRKYQEQRQLVPYRGQGFDGVGPREPFRPMNSKMDPERASRPLTEEEKLQRDMKGISLKYQGDASNPANESADIPEDQNCSVWLTNLPPDCTYRDLLRAIAVHHPGKVYATYISPPSAQGPYHLPSRGHSAAKVVFYYPWSARQLIYVANYVGLWVRGYPARAVPNRIRAAPQSYENNTTRCLTIEGPADTVNTTTLAQLWDGYFDWQTEEVLTVAEWVDNGGVRVRRIVWRFGSHRAQAVAAFGYIRDHLPHIWRFYDADPCDVQMQHP